MPAKPYLTARANCRTARAHLFFTFAMLAATVSMAAERTVYLGHAAPLSGPIAHIGKDNENAAVMAIDALNRQPMTIAGDTIKFVLLSEDDASDPRLATTVAQKLADAGVAGVVEHINSGNSIPASKIYHAAGIPMISPNTTSPQFTRQGYNTVFRILADDVRLGSILAREAHRRGIKTVALIDDRTAYGQGMRDEFKKHAEKLGIKVVSSQYTNDKAVDFSVILTSIRSKNPDAIFFGGLDHSAGPMLKQMKQLNINSKLIGGDAVCTPSFSTLATHGLVDDKVLCGESGGLENSDGRPALKQFKADYKSRFKKDLTMYGAFSYDAVMAIAHSMKQADSTDPSRYLAALAAIDYEGVTGRIRFDSHGDIRDGLISVYTYRNGERVLLDVVR